MILGFPKVTQMKSAKGGSVANHFIIETRMYIYLQSYESLIARKHKRSGQIVLDKETWDYSKTTSRYRNLFLGESTAETRVKLRDGFHKFRSLNA